MSDTNGPPMIEIRGVTKHFRQSTGVFSTPRLVRAVDGVSMSMK